MDGGKASKINRRTPGNKKSIDDRATNKSVKGFDLGTIPEVQNSPALGAEEEDQEALDAFRQAERLSRGQFHLEEEQRDPLQSRNQSKYMESDEMTERTKKRQKEV